jgi:hypothetical protein
MTEWKTPIRAHIYRRFALEVRMVCAKCGHEDKDGVKFCSECGASVKARKTLREVKKPHSSEWLLGTILVVGALIAIRLVLWAISSSESRVTSVAHTKVAPRSQHVTGAMACVTNIDDVAILAQAYTRRDSDALLGLVGRQKAIPLAAGTAVTVLVADTPFAGIDALYVDSGSYIGERCYGVAAFLAPD